MATQRVTITLPDYLAKRLRRTARERRKPLSRIIAEDLETAERARIEALMREGYREFSALNKQLAEEALPAAVEILPEWSDAAKSTG